MKRDFEDFDRRHRATRRSMERARMISTVLFIAGVALLAMAVGFILVQPEAVGAWFGRLAAGYRVGH
ncbi:hypothetical protein ACQVP2_35735 [Methylobacterium aquaticum]|uniref:hypothetical protein n=1 Tax=Methylobacterium aquaticum TaxID=270351 RepID=UPI003D17DC84